MKKLTLLIILALMTLTAISQTIAQDTSKSTVPNNLSLKPVSTVIAGTEYKAFTLPQTRIIIKELQTLDLLNTMNEWNIKFTNELKNQNQSFREQVSAYKTLDTNNQVIIGNQTTIISNLNAVIHIKNDTIRSQRTKLLIGGVLSIGIIAALLIR